MDIRRSSTRAMFAVALLAVLSFAFGAYLWMNGVSSPHGTGILANANGPVDIPQATTTPITHYGPEDGSVDASLISPDNVTFHIVDIQRGVSSWLFHIHAHNNAAASVVIQDPTSDHYFMLSGKGTPGTPIAASQIFLKLTAPETTNLAMHPALSTSLAAGADGDGWLVANLTNYAYQPFQLLYVYGTVSAMACTDPNDQSTCRPDTGYRTLVWQL